jgi:hypothetical protein
MSGFSNLKEIEKREVFESSKVLAFALWLNSLDVDPFVYNLVDDLSVIIGL